jgi:hypothetical protein
MDGAALSGFTEIIMQTSSTVTACRTSLENAQVLGDAVPLMIVQQDWNGWRKAWAPVSALEDVHWYQPPGAPKPLVHGYVACAALVSGQLPHDCSSAPHRLLVCVLRQHTGSAVFDALVERANLSSRH